MKKTIRDFDVQGKRVLVRVDYNMPMEDGQVADNFRIDASLDTLNYLLDHGCSIVIMSHMGEPKGAPDPQFSLKPVAERAAELLGREIKFYDDCVGSEVEAAAAALQPGEVMMLENVRFHQEELDASPEFAEKLAKLGEIYVNDSFAVDHRRQASVSGVPAFLPGLEGFLVEKEVNYITGALETPDRPLVAVLGGAKVSTKIPILENFIPKVDALFLTGPIANTFSLALGNEIGQSIAEPDMVETVKRLIELAKVENTEIFLPEEVLVSKSVKEPDGVRTTTLDAVLPDEYIVDATPAYAERLRRAIYEFLDFNGTATVIWNGPLGITEVKEFSEGTRAMAEMIASVKGTTIVGGGDTASYVDEHQLHQKFTWVSTGGGASLELMSGKSLPGVDALLDK